MHKHSHHELRTQGTGQPYLPKGINPSDEILRLIQARQLGLAPHGSHFYKVARYLSMQLPALLREEEFNMGEINKIFASQWLSGRQVAFGSKCNKLIVFDLVSGQKAQIPSLKSSDTSLPAECPCGIHSIAVNPSRSLLATGGENTNDLAVYKLPTFDPLCIGEGGHNDWIFDIKFLDDQFVATGSRDSRLALWCIKEDENFGSTATVHNVQLPEYGIKRPIIFKSCRKAEKVRALCYNENRKELAVLSLNAFLHCWDMEHFIQKSQKKLTYQRENVCMTVNKDRSLYAVGSQSHVTLIDPRNLQMVNPIASKHRGCGIRSVNFNEDILSIGTGAGGIFFYDIRAQKYQDLNCGHPCSLTVGKGWLLHDETYQDFFMDQEYPNAVYTHCFDESGTKLFAAGGPLPAGLWGNYAGIWQ